MGAMNPIWKQALINLLIWKEYRERMERGDVCRCRPLVDGPIDYKRTLRAFTTRADVVSYATGDVDDDDDDYDPNTDWRPFCEICLKARPLKPLLVPDTKLYDGGR